MDKVTRQCPQTTTLFEEKGEPKRESSRGPSAYQPNALILPRYAKPAETWASFVNCPYHALSRTWTDARLCHQKGWDSFFSLKCCLTSTETIRTVRDEGPRTTHLDFHTAPELGFFLPIQCCFTSTEIIRTIRDAGAQDGYLDFHTVPELLLEFQCSVSFCGRTRPVQQVRPLLDPPPPPPHPHPHRQPHPLPPPLPLAYSGCTPLPV